MDIIEEFEYDKNLISVWFEEMKTVPVVHFEPILDEDTIALIKNITLRLNYSDDVFVMSVQVLEDFIRRKDIALTVINDPLLHIFCVTFICGKYNNIKTTHHIKCETLQYYLSVYSNKQYNLNQIKSAEREILKALDYELPKNTKANDVNIMYMYFVHPLKVKTRVLELCTEILNLAVLFWPRIYAKLNSIYSGTKLKGVFKNLLAHRCYIPSGIILTGMRSIKLFKVLDKDRIGTELQGITGIHVDHLHLLGDILYKIANKKLFSTN